MKKTINNLFIRYSLFYVVILTSILLCSPVQAKDYEVEQLPALSPDSVHQVVARRVTNYFTQTHYRNFKLDNVFSAKIFDRYLKLLDANKAIFIQNDIAQFREQQNQLSYELKSGNVQTAFDLYNLALKKRFQRYKYALSLLEQPIDFNQDETIDFKRDDIAWPTTEQELDVYWQKRVTYDQLSLALTGKNEQQIKEALTKRYNRILRTLIQSKPEDAFQVFLNAFAREIDPHTSYLAPRIKRDFDSDMSLSFEGIGATLTQDDDYTSIVSFITGGPAEKSKQLVVGDRIIGVGQDGKPIEDVIGWRLDDIVEKIRGPKDTIIKLEILPAGNNSKSKIIEIKRDKIHFEDREAKLTIKETLQGKVAVIEIPSFYIGLTKKVASLLQEVNQQDNLKGTIIDLRNNGGGSLGEVINLTGLFINKGPVVQVRDNKQKVTIYEDRDDAIYYQGPIVVMINRYSASASEIFSAALQDYGRALIVGETSYGKGTVQTSRSLAYPTDPALHPEWEALGGIQYTIQKFYRINGGSTQLKGVTPDIEMLTTNYIDETGERFLDNALPWDKVPSAKYATLFDFKKIVPELTQKHLARIKTNPEFIYLAEDVADYNLKKDSSYSISLNKVVREKELKEYDDKQLARMNQRLTNAGLMTVRKLEDVPKDFKIPDAYLDEAIQMTIDLASNYPSISVALPTNTKVIRLNVAP